MNCFKCSFLEPKFGMDCLCWLDSTVHRVQPFLLALYGLIKVIWIWIWILSKAVSESGYLFSRCFFALLYCCCSVLRNLSWSPVFLFLFSSSHPIWHSVSVFVCVCVWVCVCVCVCVYVCMFVSMCVFQNTEYIIHPITSNCSVNWHIKFKWFYILCGLYGHSFSL